MPLDFELLELSCVGAVRGEYARNSGERPEVRVVESISASDGSRSRIVGIPRAKVSFGSDFSLGLGVGQGAAKVKWFSTADFAQGQLVNFPIQRILAGLRRQHQQ